MGGKAEVKIDPDFAAIIHGEDYRVFLTPEGDSKGLSVTNKTPTGFEVREQQGGTSAIAFQYRIVARPKVDNHTATRLAKYDLPAPLHIPTAGTSCRKPRRLRRRRRNLAVATESRT